MRRAMPAKDTHVDAVFLLITAVFFGLTWGFVLLCERV
jgi:hypothetical protein